jgi:predicted MFS family arabinose efflux permease
MEGGMDSASENGQTASLRRSAHRLTAREWLLLLVLASVQFTHNVDFMIIMPLGSVYMKEMRLEPQDFGYVIAAYTVAAGLAGLVASRVLDRFGRKAALLCLYSGFVTGTFVCAIAPNYWTLLAGRTVAGAFGGVAAAVVLAIIGDAFPDSRRGAATGVVMTAFSLASILGVPLGLVLEEWYGWHMPFLALAGLGLIVLALATILLPPLRGHLGKHPRRPQSMFRMVTDANHLRALTLMATLMLGSFTIFPFLPTYLEFNVGLPHDKVGLMYVFGGATTLLTLTPIGRLADAWGKLRVFRIFATVLLGLIAVASNMPAGLSIALVLLITTGLFVASSGRMVPAVAMITASAAPADRGGFMSLNAAVQHLTCGLATVIAGCIIVGEKGQPLEGFSLVGAIACLSTALTLILAGRLRTAPGGVTAPDAAEVEALAV